MGGARPPTLGTSLAKPPPTPVTSSAHCPGTLYRTGFERAVQKAEGQQNGDRRTVRRGQSVRAPVRPGLGQVGGHRKAAE